MDSLRPLYRALLVAACVLAVFWGGTAPAHASVQADFNGDGIPDVVEIQPVPGEGLIVRMSGAQPQILRARGRILSIVATDINHDGKLDITAVSERRGLIVWLNGRRGRFKATKRVYRPRPMRWSRRGGTAERRDTDGRDGAQTAGDQSQDAVPGRGGFGSCPVPPLSHRVIVGAHDARSAGFLNPHSSRAPPFSSLTAVL